MSFPHRFAMWIRALVSRSRVEREMDREMRAHIEMETENNVARGMTADEARRQALVAFGGVDTQREAVRDERGTRWLSDLTTDLRFAMRAWRLRPGFTATAAVTLAIGLGVMTLVYSWANYTLYRPLPGVRDADRVAEFVFEKEPGDGTGISYPNIVDLGHLVHGITGIAGSGWGPLQLAGGSQPPLAADGSVVTEHYFDLLGVRPRLGRFFSPEESDPHANARVAVISEQIWNSRFGGAPDVLGQHLRVNAIDFTIIGVVPSAFTGISRQQVTDLWLPTSAYAAVRHNAHFDLANRKIGAFMETVVRLRDGVTVSAAQAGMRRVMARLVAAYPDANENYAEDIPTAYRVLGMPSYMLERVSHTMRILLGTVALVLLLACANTANLLLFRGVRRRGEFAVRRALGASRGRIVRQHVVEGVALAMAGVILGLVVAVVIRRLLASQTIPGLPPVGDIRLDWRVIAFSVAVALTASIAFGLIPAIAALRSDSAAQLKQAVRASTGGAARVRSGFMVVQLAAAVALVVGAALLTRTLINLQRLDLGFDPSHVTSAIISPDPQGYSAARVAAFRRALLEDLAAQPGVATVSLASATPLGAGGTWITDYATTPDPGKTWPVHADQLWVTPDFFGTLRIPILVGRGLAATDDDSLSAIVISRGMARRLFGSGNPIGATIYERSFMGISPRRVVGVAQDVRSGDIRTGDQPVAYAPIQRQVFGNTDFLLLRSSRSTGDAARMIRTAVADFDPSLPIGAALSMQDMVARTYASEQLLTRVMGLVAILAVILASVGLYGLIAYFVSERTREIGLRMALGARAANVVSLVARQALLLVLLGLVAGGVTAAFMSRMLASTLFGVARLDPITYAGAAVFAVLLGAAASAMPAWLATRVNPVDALRSE